MSAISTIAGSTGLAGGLFGGGQSSGSQTTTSRVQVPGFLQDLSQQQADTAGTALSDLEQQIQQGGLVADFTPDQIAAFEQARDVAGGAGGFIPTAQQTTLEAAQGTGDSAGVQQLLDTASGQGITSEGFQGAFESALRDAQPEISSAFSLAGRSGSGLESTAQTQAAADAFANLFGQERQRQLRAGQTLAQRELQAAQQLPGLAMADANILQSIGQQQQQQEQQMLDAPLQAQESLIQAAGGPIPMGSFLGSSSTQPLTSNTGAGILGGASTGLGIGSMMAPSGATGLAALGGPAGIGLGVGGALLGGLL